MRTKGIGPRDLGMSKSPAKMMASPAKVGPGKRGLFNKRGTTEAAQLDKGRRVEEGSVVRKDDYDLSSQSGRDAFRSDSSASRANRRASTNAYQADLKAANNAGKSTKAIRETRASSEKTRNVTLQNDTQSNTTKADRTQDTEPARFVVNRKGAKKQKNTAQVMAGGTGSEVNRIKNQAGKKAITGRLRDF